MIYHIIMMHLHTQTKQCERINYIRGTHIRTQTQEVEVGPDHTTQCTHSFKIRISK